MKMKTQHSKSVWCSEKLRGKLIVPCTCVKKSEKPQTNNCVALEELGKFKTKQTQKQYIRRVFWVLFIYLFI